MIDLMIVGAQKAGRTSLKNYLGEHPNISTHDQKEIGYFVVDEEYREGIEKADEKYFHDYRKGSTLIAKNAMLYAHTEELKSLSKCNPQCKIVIMLRNPIDRMYRAFWMEQFYGSVKTDCTAMQEVIACGVRDTRDRRYEIFVGMSLYINHLRYIYANFPKEQVKIFSFKGFKKDLLSYCKEVYEWLRVSFDFQPATHVVNNETKKTQSLTYSRLTNRIVNNNNPIKKPIKKVVAASANHKLGQALRGINKTEKRPDPVPADMRTYLKTFFEPYNKYVQQLTGFDTELWNQ